MIRTLIVASMLCMGSATPARAQQSPDTGLAQRLAGACGTEGGFGRKFGDTRTGAISMQRAGPEWPEVSTLEVLYTPNSNRLQTVVGWIERPDKAAAEALARDVFDRARTSTPTPARAGWVEDEEIYVVERPGLRVEIGALGKTLTIGCINPELRQRTIDEAFGRVPIDERPVPPTVALPPAPPANVCAAPPTRDAFVASMEPSLDQIMGYGQRANSYQETLLRWHGQTLKGKGAWTDEDERAFALALLGDRTISREVTAAMNDLMPLLSTTMELGAALKVKDNARACTSGVQVMGVMQRLIASNTRQWARTRELINAEAARLGVTLD